MRLPDDAKRSNSDQSSFLRSTTVVVQPGTTLRLDALGNFELTFR